MRFIGAVCMNVSMLHWHYLMHPNSHCRDKYVWNICTPTMQATDLVQCNMVGSHPQWWSAEYILEISEEHYMCSGNSCVGKCTTSEIYWSLRVSCENVIFCDPFFSEPTRSCKWLEVCIFQHKLPLAGFEKTWLILNLTGTDFIVVEMVLFGQHSFVRFCCFSKMPKQIVKKM